MQCCNKTKEKILWLTSEVFCFKITLNSSKNHCKMFSMDPFDFESVMSRHLFEGQQNHPMTPPVHSSNSNSSTDYFLCDDSITDSDSCFNSDQENNNEIKEWVVQKRNFSFFSVLTFSRFFQTHSKVQTFQMCFTASAAKASSESARAQTNAEYKWSLWRSSNAYTDTSLWKTT